MKKTYNLFIVLASILFFNTSLTAQCSDVYLYRVNNTLLQSESTIYVFHEGEQIVAANLGDRYKTSLCSPGQYEFVVKTNPNASSVIRKTIQVEKGNNYHLKLACLLVGEVATIDLVPASKGRRDVNKGAKFKGAIKSFNMPQSSMAGNQNQGNAGSTTNTGVSSPISTPTDGAFQRIQTSNGFKFEVVNVSKAGDMMRLDYKITNMTGNDRVLTAEGRSSAFYDDLGNFFNIREVCIMSSCSKSGIEKSESQVFINGNLYVQYGSSSVVPYGIPVTGSIVFRGLNNRATKFIRGGVTFRSANKTNNRDYVNFRINYNNIIFPSEVDPNNARNRIVGDVGIELTEVERVGEEVVLRFNLKNAANEDKLVNIKGAQAYDNLGNETKLSGLSFGAQEISKNRYNRSHTVPASTNTFFKVELSPLNKSANKIVRLKVQFDGYELEWNDISITGKGARAMNTNSQVNSSSGLVSTNNRSSKNASYIVYNDFELKIKNKETLYGQRIILEKIYFKTGSDVILADSNNQLDDLAGLLKSNQLLKVEVSGHTDNVGDNVSNMLLSQKRADAIKYYMIAKVIQPERVKSVGKGESEPIINNTSAETRKENRRVEIMVIQ